MEPDESGRAIRNTDNESLSFDCERIGIAGGGVDDNLKAPYSQRELNVTDVSGHIQKTDLVDLFPGLDEGEHFRGRRVNFHHDVALMQTSINCRQTENDYEIRSLNDSLFIRKRSIKKTQ